MTPPYLLDDCIHYILKYLQPYNSTLFNCLLVNRFWCKATVPLLYADPFHYRLHNNNKFLIITTLILCFNKTEILQLKNHNNIINDEHKPLFKYSKYLKNFDCDEIDFAFFIWLKSNPSVFNNEDEHKKTLSIFRQSILNQCNNIKQLKISLLYNCWNVQTIKTIASNLANLNSLILNVNSDNEISVEFLKNIGNVCLKLRKLEILSLNSFITNDLKENFCKIIQKQNNLEVIKLSIYCQNFLNDVLSSLEFQKHSLVDIELRFDINFSNISFKNFVNLYNLKYLKFRYHGGDEYEILKYASFKLKRLELIVDDRNDDSHLTSLIIKYLGASLQELKFGGELKHSIIENISTYCLNLISLEINIYQNINLLILSYFKNLRIRILNIRDFNTSGMDMTFKNLANNLPINVKEVYFLCRPSYFREFLENCHNFLEVIGLEGPIVTKLTLFEIILDYIEKSNDNLKCFGTTQLKKEWSEEELKLLNQIRSKGVKIVDFYSIYDKPVGNSQ